MIDWEIDVFDEMARAVLAVSPRAYVSSQYVSAPPQFPAVSIVETSNVSDPYTGDSSGEEKTAAVTYTVNVYSNSVEDPKAECRALMAAIADRMRFRNMARTMCAPVDNAADPSIYRMVARFTGVIDANGTHYGR